MPITPRSYESRPYVRPAYEPDTRTLQELMRMAGESRSRQVGQRGQNQAQLLFTLGQIISQGLGGMRQERAQKEAAAFEAKKYQDEQERKHFGDRLNLAQFEALQEERDANRTAREDAARVAQEATAYKRGGDVAEEVGYGPMSEPQLESVMQGPAAGRARYVFGPGTAEGPELQPTRPQQESIQARTAIEGMGGVIGPNGQVVMPPKPEQEPNPTEASLAMMAARGDQSAARALQTLRGMRQSAPTEKNPIAVIGPDGQPVYMLPSDAVGKRPASNREQGRPVTSGDAGRIAELDTSLDDVEVLRGAVSGNKATGTAAFVGSKLPNWVTEITGWGTDAKSKNAVIARVKQVIGKALEGGVLRKEDEVKYKDILPIISDVPEVVVTKINGLQAAIAKRRERELDAREDAGYDVSEFRKRTRTAPQGTLKIRMKAPDGSVQEVDPSLVKHYESLGAKVMK